MSTGMKRAGKSEDGISKADPHLASKRDIDDMEYAIGMLKVKLHSTTNLPDKVRLYNQIKTLQDNISRLRSEA